MQQQQNMLSEKSKSDLLTLSVKVALPIFIGLVAKVCYELKQRRSLSLLAWIGIMGLSIVAGYFAGIICDYYHMENESRIIVPMATLLGEKIFEFIFSRQFWEICKDSLKAALSHWTNKLNEKNDADN